MNLTANLRKKVVRSYMFAITLIALVLGAGCKMPTALQDLTASESKEATLALSFSSSSGRTIQPGIDMSPSYYEISGTGPDGKTFAKTTPLSPVEIKGLAVGQWSISVSGKNNSGQSIGYGTGVKNLVSGTTTGLSILVAPISGNGTLALDLTWPAANVTAPSVEAILIPSTGSNIQLPVVLASGRATSSKAVAAGYYTLVLNLLDNGTVVMGTIEVVRIVTDQTTTGAFSFSDLNALSGVCQINLSPALSDPLVVTVSGGSTTLATGSSMTLTASAGTGVTNVVYVWYLNGVNVGTGASFVFGGAAVPLVAGSYRASVSAYTADGSRAGSTTYAFSVADAVAAAYVGPPLAGLVGPRVALTSQTGGTLAAGSYTGKRFTTPVGFSQTGTYNFTDCEFQAGFTVIFGGAAVTRVVNLDHCRLLTYGVYFEDGGQKNWTIKWSDMQGDGQAIRPKGLVIYDNVTPTPFVVEDSIVSISNLGNPAAHVEAMQSLGGNSMRFTRVRFITPGPYQDGITGQTASINNTSGDALFDECEFLSANAFYYTVYSNGANVVFKNCRMVRGIAGYVYPNSTVMASYIDCKDLVTGASIN